MSSNDHVDPVPASYPRSRRAIGDFATVEVNGARLAYVEKGSGEAVILVHGSISDLRIWEKQIDALAARHRVIAYSERYAWPNDEVADGAGDPIEPHVEELAALIRQLNAAPAHLIGNSWGALVCLLTAKRYPELVRSLVLEEPPLMTLFVNVPPSPEEIGGLFQTRPAAAAALVDFFENTMGPSLGLMQAGQLDDAVEKFARGVIGERSYAELPDSLKGMMLDNGRMFLEQQLRGGFPEFHDDDVRRIAAPALLLRSERSPEMFRQIAARLQELLPDAVMVDIRDASHVMHYENPAAVNAAVLEFLAKH